MLLCSFVSVLESDGARSRAWIALTSFYWATMSAGAEIAQFLPCFGHERAAWLLFFFLFFGGGRRKKPDPLIYELASKRLALEVFKSCSPRHGGAIGGLRRDRGLEAPQTVFPRRFEIRIGLQAALVWPFISCRRGLCPKAAGMKCYITFTESTQSFSAPKH